MTGHVCGGFDESLDNLFVKNFQWVYDMVYADLSSTEVKTTIITLPHKHPKRATCQHFERVRACVVA